VDADQQQQKGEEVEQEAEAERYEGRWQAVSISCAEGMLKGSGSTSGNSS
jgi:hypothetical protein